METSDLVNQLQATLEIVMYMSIPVLITAVAVGVITGIIQAVTQVQDPSLPMTFKLLAIVIVLFIAGPALTVPLVREAGMLFDGFSSMTH